MIDSTRRYGYGTALAIYRGAVRCLESYHKTIRWLTFVGKSVRR